MTVTDFFKKYLGQRVDYDKAYAYQCVDLIKQYLHDCYGLNPGEWGNAIDYYRNPNPAILDKFDKIRPETAQPGDILIFTSIVPAGHIAIAANDKQMVEQNGATGDGDGRGGDEVRYRDIPYNRLVGILRPKKGSNKMNRGRAIRVLRIFYHGNPTEEQIVKTTGQDEDKWLDTARNNAGFQTQTRRLQAWDSKIAEIESLKKQLADAQTGQSGELTLIGKAVVGVLANFGYKKG